MDSISDRHNAVEQLSVHDRHLLEPQLRHRPHGLLVLIGPDLAQRHVDDRAGEVGEQPADVAHFEGRVADLGPEGADEAGEWDGDTHDVGNVSCGSVSLLRTIRGTQEAYLAH